MSDKQKNLFVFCFSGLVIFVFYYLHFKYTTNIPIFDDYDAVIYFLSSFADTNTFSGKLMWIVTQHREHRYIFPRIFLLIYHYIFGEINFKVIIFIGHIALLGTFILIIQAINFKNLIRDNLNRALIIVSVTLLFFNIQYWEGSTWAIASFFFYFGMMFSFISLYLLAKKNGSFVWAMIFAILAAGTSGNGLLVFIIGALLLYFRKGFSKEFFYWLAAAAIIYFLYFWNYVSPADQTPVSVVLFQKPLKLILFYLSYIGSVFRQIPGVGNAVSILSGAAAIALLIFLILKKYYRSNPAIFGFILFLFLTMLTSSLARVDVGFISRYVIFSTLLIICFCISIIETYSERIYKFILLLFLLLSLSFNIYSFIFNFDDLKKMKGIITEGAILAKAGDYSLLIYPDSANVKSILQNGISKNIYRLPDFNYENFLSDIDLTSKPLTADITNTFNNFVDTKEFIYVNGWVNLIDEATNNNLRIYLVLKSEKNLFALNTSTIRKKELRAENNQRVTDNSSYSLALLKNHMNIPPGIYELGFYIGKDKNIGKYSYIITDKKINF
ncbi:MAG: hypothetical protein ABI792_08855 [bacterium]